MPKLTKRFVDDLGPEHSGKIIRDDLLTGFAARRNGNGTITFLVEYRAGRGRQFPNRRLSLGKYGVLTPDDARQAARSILARVARGEDPAAARAARASEITVREMLLAAVEQHWKPKRRPSTARAFEEAIRRTLIPEFGSLRLSDLSRGHIAAWHSKQIHRPRAANIDVAILSKALSLAVSAGLAADNPARGVEFFPHRTRSRVVSDEELFRLWAAMSMEDVRPAAVLLFKLLALTGCRRDEWRTARWSDLDFPRGVFRLRAENGKTGARVVPLSKPVLAVLSTADERSPFVVPNDAGDAPLSRTTVHGAWRRVLAGADLDDLRLHDLRHAFATRGAALGGSALILRDALGHKTLSMTSRYVAEQTDPVRVLAERIGAGILEAAQQEQTERQPRFLRRSGG